MRRKIIPVAPAETRTEGGHFDPWGFFVNNFPYLVREARAARQEGHSHRGFHVGAVVVAASLDGSSLHLFRGANVKRSAKEKVCAEKIALGLAAKNGMQDIIAIVVSGPKQTDHGSGIETPTLHCCEACRAQLESEVNNDALIATVLPNTDKYQLQTAEELTTFHTQVARGEMPRGVPLIVDPDFRKWEHSRAHYFALAGDLRPYESAQDRATAITAARVGVTGLTIAA